MPNPGSANRAEFWRTKTVLVTGATGFLGGWLVRRLLELGSEVVTIVRRTRRHSQYELRNFRPRVAEVRGSVHDHALIDEVFRQREIDVVFHTAAMADITQVIQNPEECFRSCVESTWWLLENVRKVQPHCVTIISSSDKAYGIQKMPIREDQFLNPKHPYEIAKATQDLTAQSYGEIYELPIAVSRCGNFYGGFDFTFNRIIPGTIRSICREEPPVIRSDGRFTRDFLYIEDAVDAKLLLAEKVAANPSLWGEAFNFSYNLQMPVIDIVEMILGMMNSSLIPDVRNEVIAETRHLTLSSDKARDELEWVPSYGFEEGLARTVKWYTDQHSALSGSGEESAEPVEDVTRQRRLSVP